MQEAKRRLAIIDMNNGEPNQGLRCIREIVKTFESEIDWEIFDARVKNEIPDLSFDILISSGGPGSPLEGGEWKERFFDLIQKTWEHNKFSFEKKFVFFICHSFQLACEFFELGTIAPRQTTSFGIYPIHKTESGKSDSMLNGLDDPYYAVDSRDWQLIQPNLDVFENHGAKILSLEKIRTHVELERAIMAVRFSDEMIGTQFHPEADPPGMKIHFSKEEIRNKVVKNFGEEKYRDMMTHLEDPDKITLTYNKILPGFIRSSLERLKESNLVPTE